ncbi:MAG: type II toxin-antitoxin system Phd/YefM family antitoxin [Thermosynechococcaceae cyanobacterium]
MHDITISKFKAQCLRLLDEVNRTGEPLTITRNKQPIVTIYPAPNSKRRVPFGISKGTGQITGDLVAPAADLDDWEALQ